MYSQWGGTERGVEFRLRSRARLSMPSCILLSHSHPVSAHRHAITQNMEDLNLFGEKSVINTNMYNQRTVQSCLNIYKCLHQKKSQYCNTEMDKVTSFHRIKNKGRGPRGVRRAFTFSKHWFRAPSLQQRGLGQALEITQFIVQIRGVGTSISWPSYFFFLSFFLFLFLLTAASKIN